ncbi:hypothetical protein V5F72_21790 [Xanthobacter flavus]|uniref:hypothetical protein n=1 Tax=Xanthobacter flavus TaxID=281 RepID=UPI003727EF8F
MRSSANPPALQPTDILPPRARASAATRRLRLAGVSPAALNDALALSEAAQDAAAQVRSRRTLAFLLCLVVAGLVSTSGTGSLPRPLMMAETAAGAATTPEGQAAGTSTADAAPDAPLSVEAQPAAPQLNTASARAPEAAAPRAASGSKDAAAATAPRPAPMPPKVARADRCIEGCAPTLPRRAEMRTPAVTPVTARPEPYVPPPPVDGPTVLDLALFPITASAALVGNAEASVGAALDAGRVAVESLARVLR